MTVLALLRHGATDWNAARRMQGRSDIPLSAAGHAALAALSPPRELAQVVWLTSPLRRAVDSAIALGIANARIEPRLIEMDWGAWEGRTLAELRQLPNDAMARAEAAGLDFRPAGGESPREVQARVHPLLRDIASAGQPVAAMTHKGVIRAVFALATGWDMCGEPPMRLDWSAAHLFELDAEGRIAVARLNLALAHRGAAAP